MLIRLFMFREVLLVSKFQYYSVKQMVKFFLSQGKEGECWDFKLEWHEKTEDLIKDIICFANTVHDENCYLIFGVSDDLEVKGINNARRKQADILDAISNLMFAGDNLPKIEVTTIEYEGKELDVLIIFNTDKTPIYLKRNYGNMNAGCIYLRTGDKNTPNKGNAEINDIENLWRKRLGLTKPPRDIIFDCLHNKLEWVEQDNVFYNAFRPEYTLRINYDETDRDSDEFYSYAMTNESTSFCNLDIMFQNTVLDSYQLVSLDSARLQVPIPTWGHICRDDYGLHAKYSYKYYVLGSDIYRLLRFLFDEENSEERDAFMHLKEVVLIYSSDEERLSFELFIEEHQDIFESYYKAVNRFNYINTGDETKTKTYKERLSVGYALNELLTDWRNNQLRKFDIEDATQKQPQA